MKLSLIVLLLAISDICHSQSSVLYNGNRKLIVDSTFQIDDNSFKYLNNLEKVLLPRIYNQIKYPEIARENNEEGVVIVLINIDSELKTNSFSIEKTKFESLLPPIKEYFQLLLENKNLLSQFKPDQWKLSIYIPIEFKINKNKFKESIKKNKTVTIETNDIARQVFIVN
jgi:hypothetical protein